jgi:hypothetical protein
MNDSVKLTITNFFCEFILDVDISLTTINLVNKIDRRNTAFILELKPMSENCAD